MDFLTEQGVQPIDATGQKFDPNLHEAIAHEPSDEIPGRRCYPSNAPRLSDERSAPPPIQCRGCEWYRGLNAALSFRAKSWNLIIVVRAESFPDDKEARLLRSSWLSHGKRPKKR